MKNALRLALAAGMLLGAAGCSKPPASAPQQKQAGTAAQGQKQAAPTPAPAAAAPPAPAPMVDDPKAVYRVPLEDSPVRGSRDALLTIVVSSDFECPFCKRVDPLMKQIEEAYKGKVRFVWKNNPLSMHANAVPAALLVEEARVQGGDAKFWAMHDKLFELAPALDRASLEKAAAEVGLSKDGVRTALDERRYLERIRRDQNLVNSLGARGTPTFFVNGRKVVGAVPFEQFKGVLDEELRKAESLVKGGVKRRDLYARIIEKGATAPVKVAAPAQKAAAPSAQAAKVPLRSDDPVRGPARAKVSVVVFSEFQCPFCSKVEPTLKQLQEAFPKDVRIVWKHLPLAFHPNAIPAAKAVEAARAQGKFWQMHDKLFTNQQRLSDAFYGEAAKEIGLDPKRFQRDLAAEGAAKRIGEDQQLAATMGTTGTPTLFVNCRKVVGAQPFESLKPIVEDEIKKADALAAKGVKLDGSFYDRICADNVAAAPPAQVAAAPTPRTGVAVAIRRDDPARGDPRAPVTVVEFSDFQCPFCSRALPAVSELEKTFGKDVRVVWKHLPLSFHPNAMPAALAAEAARAQGKFWQMHDKLFAQQQALSPAVYEQSASELELDLGKFRAALQASETRARVDADLEAARQAGVTGTPTFVVNGEVVVGSGALRDTVQRHLEKARAAKR
jgi:protein-disulfide isomerase